RERLAADLEVAQRRRISFEELRTLHEAPATKLDVMAWCRRARVLPERNVEHLLGRHRRVRVEPPVERNAGMALAQCLCDQELSACVASGGIVRGVSNERPIVGRTM